jgi:ATP-dependent helicase HrpB
LEQFLKLAEQNGLKLDEGPAKPEAIQRCILAGFGDSVAQRIDKGSARCRLLHGRKASLGRDTVVRDAPLFVAAEITEIGRTQGEIETSLGLCTAVHEDWLREIHPHAFQEQDEVVYDPTLRKAVRWIRRCYHDLPLQEKLSEDVPQDKAAALLAEQVLSGKCPLKEWTDEIDQWIARLNWLSKECPEYELPPIGEKDKKSLIEQLCLGASGYKDIKDKPVWPTLKSWLSPSQLSLLDKMAPERWALPNAKGKGGKIRYSVDRPPVLSAKIQDLYGVNETPRIASGKIPVTLEILGPNFRPLQMTGDLASFWKTTYPQLKPELQRRYPKHVWK